MKAAALTGFRSMSMVELPGDPPPDAFLRLSQGRDGLSKILVSPDA